MAITTHALKWRWDNFKTMESTTNYHTFTRWTTRILKTTNLKVKVTGARIRTLGYTGMILAKVLKMNMKTAQKRKKRPLTQTMSRIQSMKHTSTINNHRLINPEGRELILTDILRDQIKISNKTTDLRTIIVTDNVSWLFFNFSVEHQHR